MIKSIIIIACSYFVTACSAPTINSSDQESSIQKKQSRDIDINVLLSGLDFLCGGHVTGAPMNGKVGPHIQWQTYTSTLEPRVLVSNITQQLGELPDKSNKDCSKWDYDTDKFLEVCTIQSAGPWSDCSQKSSTVRSVVMSSLMTH